MHIVHAMDRGRISTDQTWDKYILVLDSNGFLRITELVRGMGTDEKVHTPPSDLLGWLNRIRQDQMSTEKYLEPKQ